MTVPPPPPTPPPATPPGGAPSAPEAPPPRGGLSTGIKIAIGCGVALLLVLILVFACFGLAGHFISRKAGDFSAAVERQEEAGKKAEELEREHRFTPPATGELNEDEVEKFFAVTDDAWDAVKDWATEMHERGERVDAGGRAGFRDAVAGATGLADARLALVDALDDHEMAPSAYVWTGMTLLRAYEARDPAGGSSGVPPKNVQIANERAEELAELEQSGDDEPDKGTVLALALLLFPRADVMMPAGFDTTLGRRP